MLHVKAAYSTCIPVVHVHAAFVNKNTFSATLFAVSNYCKDRQ